MWPVLMKIEMGLITLKVDLINFERYIIYIGMCTVRKYTECSLAWYIIGIKSVSWKINKVVASWTEVGQLSGDIVIVPHWFDCPSLSLVWL